MRYLFWTVKVKQDVRQSEREGGLLKKATRPREAALFGIRRNNGGWFYDKAGAMKENRIK